MKAVWAASDHLTRGNWQFSGIRSRIYLPAADPNPAAGLAGET